MEDSVGKEIQLGATVRYGTISRPKEGRVVKIVQRLVKHLVKDGLVGWRMEERQRSFILIVSTGPYSSFITLKPSNVLVVTDESQRPDLVSRPAH